jgi:hypothetical protein
MFVEYMTLMNKKEAQALFDASAKMKPSEKEKLYIVKENSEYQAVLKMKKKEQKWMLTLDEKGVYAKREMTKGYVVEMLLTIVCAVLFAVFLAMSFIKPDSMVIFVWISLVALFSGLFVSWRQLFRPSVALKIFLIRIL